MKVVSIRMIYMDMGFTFGLIRKYISESGGIIRCMGKGRYSGMMV